MSKHIPPASSAKPRCAWAASHELLIAYHDDEWGVPLHDDRGLFEMLCLEGAQAGLSWLTVLKKRENYRRAFDGFDPQRVARYDARKLAALLADPGIIRNRLKVAGVVESAKAYLRLREDGQTFDKYLWTFVDGRPLVRRPKTLADIPATSPESDALSKDLKRRGFKFVGSTICYAFMQAVGMVNDHTRDCWKAPPGAKRT
jgi:DNA-3-methyladenine glycosylase I